MMSFMKPLGTTVFKSALGIPPGLSKCQALAT
jgi:hypothetical protein